MWLYLPTSCRSALAAGVWTSGSDSLYQALEQSCMWRTKSRPAASWSRIWKRNDWTQRLFGQTYSPSTASRGVESWIGSLAATRASRSVTQASDLEPMTHATSGLTSPESSQMSLPGFASSRTSVLICDLDSVKSPETFKAWATRLRQHCLQRRKSVLLTAGNDCSSLPWQTPNAAAEAPNLGSNIKRGPKSLLAQAQAAWPTATSNMHTGAGTQGRNGGMNLQTATAQWATPTSRDWKDGSDPSSAVATNSLLGRQAPRTQMHGDECSQSGQTSRRRLNYRFVTWLMGWPEGWVELTSYTSSETASSPNKPLTPCTY